MCLLMLGCRSRKKAVQISEQQRTETTSADTNVVVSEEKKLHELDKKTEKIDQKENSNDGDIVIKGKTDSLNKTTMIDTQPQLINMTYKTKDTFINRKVLA